MYICSALKPIFRLQIYLHLLRLVIEEYVGKTIKALLWTVDMSIKSEFPLHRILLIIYSSILGKTRTTIVHRKILFFVLRQLTDDFKEEYTEKESVQYQFHIFLGNNLFLIICFLRGAN